MTTPARRVPLTPRRLRDLMRSALDAEYARLFAPLARSLATTARPGTPLATAFEQLIAAALEAQRRGVRLSAQAPEVRAVIALVNDALAQHRALLAVLADDLTMSGVRAGAQIARWMAFPGMSTQQLRALGIDWRVPDIDAVLRVLSLQGRREWADALGTYQQAIIDAVTRRLVANVLQGANPRQAVEDIQRLLPAMSAHRVEAIARTVQLNAYRRSTSINYVANAHIIEPEAIRVAALDDRTCLGCVVLHGTRVPIGEPLIEHYNGRCTTVPVVRGQQFAVRSGEAWLVDQPSETQQRIMGSPRYRAWVEGAVELRDFAQTTRDPLFGDMLATASLRGLLGDAARDFYARP